MSANVSTASNSAASVHQNVVPSEVGWQFVPQYYTFVNKQPHRLHCFYTKNSTFIHGTEGEDGRPCNGQQEIHQKIMQIGFQDCKVFIHSVDAQASAAGGIIIQVIGEMSNRGEPWRKFVQTFFLAEQPNGYFVLNDIFRFLKEECVEEDEAAEPADVQVGASPAPISEKQLEPEPAPPVNIPVAPQVAYQPEVVVEPTQEYAQPLAEEPKVNGVHQLEAPKEEVEAPIIAPVEVNVPVEVKVPEAPSEAPEPEPEPEPISESVTVPASATAPAPAPAAPQAAPSPKLTPATLPTPAQAKTWASLAANNRSKWGAMVAQESQGVSEKKVAPSPPTRSGAQTPVDSQATTERMQKQDRDGFQRQGDRRAQTEIKTPHVFVKGVVEKISEEQLREILAQYGSILKIEIVRDRACAFVHYELIESAKAAIAASAQSDPSGIAVDIGQDKPHIIHIERRMEKHERPPARRGGAGAGAGGHFRGQDGFRGQQEDRGGAYRGQQEGGGRGRGRGRNGPPSSGQRGRA